MRGNALFLGSVIAPQRCARHSIACPSRPCRVAQARELAARLAA